MPETTIKEWGNSLAIRIPKSILKKANIHQGDHVSFKFLDGNILIIPDKKQTLEFLLSKVTDENKHHEVHWGKEGAEEW
ncbi:MAG: AbrB/MazE/SpoVT family DNA-binding domain-containing protein [Silvanigrellaceae bacterium]|nr:AbrB/MazE/SpoVT family DNA-binding domain-containing protein [Silvanigrellaceae bacterium]